MRLVGPIPDQQVYDGGAPSDRATYGLPWWSCDNVQAVESATLIAYQNNAAASDSRFKMHAACEALDAVEIHVLQARAWFSKENNESVVGLTHCNLGVPWIEIGNREPGDGTLTHEMAHAIQRCDAKGPAPLVGQDPTYDSDSDPAHLNWSRYGINAGILQIEFVDVNETATRDAQIEACGEDAGCQLDAGVFP